MWEPTVPLLSFSTMTRTTPLWRLQKEVHWGAQAELPTWREPAPTKHVGVHKETPFIPQKEQEAENWFSSEHRGMPISSLCSQVLPGLEGFREACGLTVHIYQVKTNQGRQMKTSVPLHPMALNSQKASAELSKQGLSRILLTGHLQSPIWGDVSRNPCQVTSTSSWLQRLHNTEPVKNLWIFPWSYRAWLLLQHTTVSPRFLYSYHPDPKENWN